MGCCHLSHCCCWVPHWVPGIYPIGCPLIRSLPLRVVEGGVPPAAVIMSLWPRLPWSSRCHRGHGPGYHSYLGRHILVIMAMWCPRCLPVVMWCPSDCPHHRECPAGRRHGRVVPPQSSLLPWVPPLPSSSLVPHPAVIVGAWWVAVAGGPSPLILVPEDALPRSSSWLWVPSWSSSWPCCASPLVVVGVWCLPTCHCGHGCPLLVVVAMVAPHLSSWSCGASPRSSSWL